MRRAGISWWAVRNGTRTPRSDSMKGGGWIWDATCTCGWDSDTGGKPMGVIRALVNDHKAEGHGAGVLATGEARELDPVLDIEIIALQQAHDLINAIDRMPAHEGVKAIATDRAQAALEAIGRAKSRGVSPVASVGAEE